MHIILVILAFIFMLGITVTIHEFGHFITAKKFGVYVHEFSIGMGPEIFSRQKGETKYSLRALPVGGFVSMAGEDVNSQPENDKVIPEDRKFFNKKYYQKIIILLAGVSLNFILAISIYSGLMLYSGTYYEPIETTITSVVKNSPAEKAGIMPGDRVKSITREDGTVYKTNDFFDIQLATYEVTDEPLVYTVERNNKTIDFPVRQKYYKKDKAWLIGVKSDGDIKHKITWYNFPYYGVKYSRDMFIQMIKSFKLLLNPDGIKLVSGPVGIVDVTSKSINHGFIPYLELIAIINLNIGLMNLLPIPVLDGGQVVLETIKRILRKNIPKILNAVLMYGSWVALIILMFVVTYYDIFKIL